MVRPAAAHGDRAPARAAVGSLVAEAVGRGDEPERLAEADVDDLRLQRRREHAARLRQRLQDRPAASVEPGVVLELRRQLIQRLVTSTPSRGYVYRVVQKFNDNGSGVRGDMKAVIKAILLDYEARSLQLADTSISHGKVKEPLVAFAAMLRGLRATGFEHIVVLAEPGTVRLLIGEALVVFWPHAVPAAWNIPVKIGGFELRLPSWPKSWFSTLAVPTRSAASTCTPRRVSVSPSILPMASMARR